jgi:hypothetical protein
LQWSSILLLQGETISFLNESNRLSTGSDIAPLSSGFQYLCFHFDFISCRELCWIKYETVHCNGSCDCSIFASIYNIYESFYLFASYWAGICSFAANQEDQLEVKSMLGSSNLEELARKQPSLLEPLLLLPMPCSIHVLIQRSATLEPFATNIAARFMDIP